MENEMKNLSEITILIPLRIDSEGRQANMDACLSYLAGYPEIRIIVLEADTESKYRPAPVCNNLTYCFIADHDLVFYRTHYLNMLLRKVETPVAGIWDSDVIVPINQISEAINHCKEGATLCYPYDGRFFSVPPIISRLYRQTRNMDVLNSNDTLHRKIHGNFSVGGAFVVDVSKYLSAGGENENFYGWGPEDTERRERIYTWGLTVKHTAGCLYHLYHPRGLNSMFANQERALCNLQEYLKICKMNRSELQEYILNSHWVKQ